MKLHLAAATRTATLAAAAAAGDPFARLLRLRPGDDHRALHEEVRARGPLVTSPLGSAVTADHAVVSAVLRSPAASVEISMPGLLGRLVAPLDDISPVPHPVAESLVARDAPDHTRLRRLVARAFTPSRLAAHRDRIARIADRLLDALPADGTVDLVEGFARPLPMLVICDVMGVPAHDQARFTAWGDALAASLGGVESVAQHRALRSAAADIQVFFADLVAARRADPGEDLVSALVASEDDDALDHRELLVTLSFLLIAGFETTVNLLGRGTEALLASPDQLRDVTDDLSLVPGLVEEGLRFVTPVRYTARQLREDLLVDTPRGPVAVAAGTEVVTLLGAANRDPLVFDDPDRFDVRRPNARDHLAFSAGPHYCLGAALARLEADVAWTALLSRHPRLAAAGPTRPAASSLINGLASLPVQLQPA